jgi:hypothetical protein
MKLLNYLQPLLKNVITVNNYNEYAEITFLRMILEENNAQLNSVMDIEALIIWITGKRDILLERLGKLVKQRNEADHLITIEESNISDEVTYLYSQINFLRRINTNAKDWEMLYPNENIIISTPEKKEIKATEAYLQREIEVIEAYSSYNYNKLSAFRSIIDQLLSSIDGINHFTKKDFTNEIAKESDRALKKIKKLIETIREKDELSDAENNMIFHWEIGTINKRGNAYRKVAGRLYDLIETHLENKEIIKGKKFEKFKWGRYGFIKKMEKDYK